MKNILILFTSLIIFSSCSECEDRLLSDLKAHRCYLMSKVSCEIHNCIIESINNQLLDADGDLELKEIIIKELELRKLDSKENIELMLEIYYL